MYDRVSAVTAITNWPALGVKLPKPLADKISVFDAVRYVETAHAITVDTSAITVENAEYAVAELAIRLLLPKPNPAEGCHPGPARHRDLDRSVTGATRSHRTAAPRLRTCGVCFRGGRREPARETHQ